MFSVVAAAVCVAFGAAAPAPRVAFGAASPAPHVYPATGIVVDETASLTVGGVAVPLAFEAGAPPPPSSRARWASDAALPCELRVEGTADRWADAALRRPGGTSTVLLEHGGAVVVRFSLGPGHAYLVDGRGGRRYYFWAGAVLRYDGPDRDADLGAFVSVSGDDLLRRRRRRPDASRDVALDGVFIHAWDDAVAVKTTVAGSPAENVAVANSIVSTRKSAFKLGTESLSNFTRVSFATSDVFDSGRGLVIYAKDGGAFDDVAFEDLRLLDFYDYAGEPSAPVDFELEHRSGYSAVRGVRVERVSPRAFAAGNATFLFDCKNDDIAAGGVEVAGLDVDWARTAAPGSGSPLGGAVRAAEPRPCPDPPGARVAALLRRARRGARD
ncbi:metallo-sulfur cluster assembly [Aureococcus anophagefferens]|nr:metallo-sulfur cluster assembly [Aureococcus anophagefferens]